MPMARLFADFGAGAHVHGFGCEPDGVDAEHSVSPRTNRAQPSGSLAGQFTTSCPCPHDTSILTVGLAPVLTLVLLPEQN